MLSMGDIYLLTMGDIFSIDVIFSSVHAALQLLYDLSPSPAICCNNPAVTSMHAKAENTFISRYLKIVK
jgi:hypothetical protein